MLSGLKRQWNISGDEVTYVYIAGSVILEKKTRNSCITQPLEARGRRHVES